MKPTKKFRILGTLIGISLWGSLTYLVYPHWSAWPLGGLFLANIIVLIGQGMKSA